MMNASACSAATIRATCGGALHGFSHDVRMARVNSAAARCIHAQRFSARFTFDTTPNCVRRARQLVLSVAGPPVGEARMKPWARIDEPGCESSHPSATI
eukprot:3666095-Pyramimonas_sp.AAC.1